MAKYSEHSFYCMKCGNKMMSLPRRDSHNYSKHHRKKLWCPWCKMEINHIECRNDEEIKEFRENWLAGAYQEELKESLNITKKEN